jgi:hypothetical protein
LYRGRGDHGVVSLVLCCFIGLLFWVKFQYYPASGLLPFSYSLRTFNQQYKFIFSVSGSLPSNLYLMPVIPACLVASGDLPRRESFRLVRNHEERLWIHPPEADKSQDDRQLERLDDPHQGMVKSRSDREKDKQQRTLLRRSQYLEILHSLPFGTQGGFTQCPVCQKE